MNRKRHILILILILLLASVTQAWAAGKGEQSESPGTPGKKPLHFVALTLVGGGKISNNAADVPLSPRFRLEFDKNVVNALIWNNNRSCFKLLNDKGETAAISVTKVDDSVDFSQRNYIFVTPEKSLKAGTGYSLHVSEKLKAKNGYSTLAGTTGGQGVVIKFTTAGTSGTAQLRSTSYSWLIWLGLLIGALIIGWVILRVRRNRK